MYNQIGLKTPRGSGTNGYVQRNLAFRQKRKPHSFRDEEVRTPPKVRVANPEILEHQRKRKVEVMLIEWAEKEEIYERYGQEEGENMVGERRKLLLEDLANGRLDLSGNRNETHQRNKEKEKRNESFKNALRIGNDYEVGAVFDPKVQERRKQKKYEEYMEREKEKVRQQLERELEEKAMRHKRKHGGDDPRDSKRSRREGSYEEERRGGRDRKRRRSRSRSVSSSRSSRDSRSRSPRRRDSRSPSSSISRSRSPKRSTTRRTRLDSRSPSSHRSAGSRSRSPASRSRSPRRRQDSPSPSPSPSRSTRSSLKDSPRHVSPVRQQSEAGSSTSTDMSAWPTRAAPAAAALLGEAGSTGDEDEEEDMYIVRSIVVIPEHSSLAR